MDSLDAEVASQISPKEALPLDSMQQSVLEQGVGEKLDQPNSGGSLTHARRSLALADFRHDMLRLSEAPFIMGPAFLSDTGLQVFTYNHYSQEDLTVNGKRVVSNGDRYTKIDFTPEDRKKFDPRKMTDSLARGVQGLTELMEAIDSGKLKVASVLTGHTNLNMALIAQRLGFKIIDQCRTADGNINKDLPEFTVAGNIADIRQRIEEFRQTGIAQKLEVRSNRLQFSPSTG